MIKAVIFDCFGVLLIDAGTSFIQKNAEHATELLEIRRRADAGLLNRRQQLQEFSRVSGMSENAVDEYFQNEHQLNVPLVELINQLKSDYKIGMVTNLGRGWFDEFIPSEIKNLFDDIIISGEVKMVKPSLEIYELACEHLEVDPPEVVFVDDIAANCMGAEVAGMSSIQYDNFDEMLASLNTLGVNARQS